MLTLHNLTTGKCCDISDQPTITSQHILVLPNENPQELEDLQSGWTKDFPGTSQSVITLRADLIRADWSHRRAQSLFLQLQLDLYLTGLPMAYWDRFTQKQFLFLEKHAAHTQHQFRKAFQLIQTFKPQSKTGQEKEEEKEPEPEKPKRDMRSIWEQFIVVSVVDGQTVTKPTRGPEFLLRPDILAMTAGVWRHFHFINSFVPPEYAYVLQHEGVQYEPAQDIYICYQVEDYPEMMQKEMTSGSPHLQDGKRWGYKRLPDNKL